MDCLDSDVLIYAADADHDLGARVRMLFDRPGTNQLVGSVLLLPEVLSKPEREARVVELSALRSFLNHLTLHPIDTSIAAMATSLGATYRLRAPDAVHLATAVSLGADRFITNNRRDFDKAIAEVDVVFPEDLPEPG